MQNQDTWTVEKILKISGAYWQSFTLHAAVKLDVFSLLEKGLNRPDDLAAELKADHRALTILLNALAAMRLIKKDCNEYQNSESSRAFLVRNSSQYIGSIILHAYNSVKSWSVLVSALKTGKTNKNILDMPENERCDFLMGMNVLASINSKNVAKAIDLSGCRNLLDLGGGPGTYAIAFCMKNPDLKATIYDLIDTKKFAEKRVKDEGLEHRIHGGVPNFFLQLSVYGPIRSEVVIASGFEPWNVETL